MILSGACVELETFQARKKVSIVFLPIRFLSFGARREGIYQDAFSFLPAIIRFYMIAYEKILGIVRSSRLAQQKLRRK